MEQKYYTGYPTEPIGGGNPYYRCIYCKRSDPEINGDLNKHLKDCEWANKEKEKLNFWTKKVPDISAYYWAIPKDKDDWLDCSPEIVYLYFNGKFSVIRPGKEKYENVDKILYWGKPIESVELPNDLKN